MKNLSIIQNKVISLRKNKKIIGLCHGVFDILHYGHIKHFEAAKKNVIIYLFPLHLINISIKDQVDPYTIKMNVFYF